MAAVKTISAEKAFSQVRSHAEKIKNNDAHRIEVMDVGDTWAQGDVALMRLAGVPDYATEIKNPSAQLAPGTTQGSRHILASLSGVKMFRRNDAGPLDGPIIESPSELTVEHPEHGDITLPAGTYAVVYQRAFAEELRRVAD